MSNKLENLKPERVFYYFEELSKIPRESGNEKAVSDFLVDTAKKLGLEPNKIPAGYKIGKAVNKVPIEEPVAVVIRHVDKKLKAVKNPSFIPIV